jgi:hypothetical protein
LRLRPVREGWLGSSSYMIVSGRIYSDYLHTDMGRHLITRFEESYPDRRLTRVKMLDLILWKGKISRRSKNCSSPRGTASRPLGQPLPASYPRTTRCSGRLSERLKPPEPFADLVPTDRKLGSRTQQELSRYDLCSPATQREWIGRLYWDVRAAAKALDVVISRSFC